MKTNEDVVYLRNEADHIGFGVRLESSRRKDGRAGKLKFLTLVCYRGILFLEAFSSAVELTGVILSSICCTALQPHSSICRAPVTVTLELLKAISWRYAYIAVVPYKT